MAHHAISSSFMALPQTYHQSLMPYQRSKSQRWTYSNTRMFSYRRTDAGKGLEPSGSTFDESDESVEGETVSLTFEDDAYSGTSVSRQGVDGSLQMMMKMPVDVLYEIFSHLHPIDILNLSRTTKALRSLLLTRYARGVWRSSLASVRALPACPPDLTEPQYASLAFDNWCQSCLATNVEKILWECRVRYCKGCIKKHFIQEDELDLWIPEQVLVEKPDTIFPLAYVLQPTKRSNGRVKPVYFLSTARKYIEELQEMANTRDDEALARWSEDKAALQSMRLTHAAQCVYWDTHWAYRRSTRPLPSRFFETVILVVLALLLAFLWRQKLLSVSL